MNTPKTRLAAAVAAATAATMLLGACRSYQSKPIAVDAARRDFLARTVDGPALAEFNAALSAHEPAAGAFDPADGISLAEAAAIALVFNGELRAARLEAGVTRATADNAGLWSDPTLGVDLSRIVNGATDDIEALASLAFTLPLSGRLELEKAEAGAEHHAELTRVARDEWAVIAELRRAWTRHAALAAEAAATREFLERVAQVMAVVERMESAGEIARIEARLIRIEDAKLRVALHALDAELVRATHAIESIVGLPPRSDRRFATDFSALSAAGRPASQGHDALVVRALAGSPALAVARAEHEVAERRLAREIRAQWPDVQLAPGFGEQDGDTQAVLGIGVTLPVLNGNRRGIAEADAARDATRGRAEGEIARILGDLLAAEERLAAALAQRELLETTLVPLVDTQYAEAREVARLGEVNTIILLESLKQQLEAKRQLIAARSDEAHALVDIEHIVGPARGPANAAAPTTATPTLPPTTEEPTP
jgi:outer membrane protein TolC